MNAPLSPQNANRVMGTYCSPPSPSPPPLYMLNLWIFFNVKNFLKQNHVIFGNLTANHLTFMEMILLVNFELYKIKNLCIIIIIFLI